MTITDDGALPSELIDARIAELGDRRGEVYRDKVKTTFAHGAILDDPAGLFNASLSAGTRRAIDLHEGDGLDEEAFGDLVVGAAAHNTSE